VNDKGRDLQLQYTSPLFEQALRLANLSEAQIQRIIEHVNLHGSCQQAPDLPDHIRHTFVVSGDITAEEHIRMQAAMQRFVDNAISKTINFPSGATVKDVETAYLLGWKLGCKGLTVYVTGSREKVVLETHATAKQKEGDAQPETTTTALTAPQNKTPEPVPLFPEMKKPRPRRLEGRTYRIGTPLGGTYVTINENGEGRGHPFEMFIHTSKAGSETAAISEALGRLSSLIMRMASPIPPRERVKEIIRQLEGIGGDRAIGFGPQRVRSLPDGIAQVLREYLDETSDEAEDHAPLPKRYVADQLLLERPQAQLELVGELCPECGEASMVNEEGCRKCHNCGYSEC
jgi:ribonucleoside-diphosphate reductase alpha chain